MEKGMTFEEFKVKVKERIKKRNDHLEDLFSAGKYREMPGEFKPNTRLVTHEGDYIPGENSEDYWRKVGDELNGTDLKFKEKYFDAMELILSPSHTEEDIDFVALEITEFTFNVKGQDYKGYIDPPYRHRVICEID